MNQTVDARGMACPLPVVNAKAALKEMNQGETAEVIVDNEIAVQNLTKFANVRHYTVTDNKVNDNEYHVFITVGEKSEETEDADTVCEACQVNGDVVAIGSSQMGNGSEELGKILMKAFIFALTKQDTFPKTVIFYNSGVFLSTEGSDSIEDLKFLESKGTQVISCGTCLNYYELTEKLAVGSVSNMYDIVEKMEAAGKIIKP
ncbi:MAG: sulfurtransferase-like selenium metabolism protein YedF [Parasporobacterium sp.]|nr:sulfurtransferase-like selenium metabolism protein YedF [Parasporobacterium sp.]